MGNRDSTGINGNQDSHNRGENSTQKNGVGPPLWTSRINNGIKPHSVHRFVRRFYFALQVAADIVVITGSMLAGFWLYHMLFTQFGIGNSSCIEGGKVQPAFNHRTDDGILHLRI